jgi:secreted trypsin-like serine protease
MKRVLLAIMVVLTSSAYFFLPHAANALHRDRSKSVSQGTHRFATFVSSSMGTCSGSLIHTSFVLTAGHCVMNMTTGSVASASSVTVTIGRADLTKPTSGGETRGVKSVSIFPALKATKSWAHDLALLKLSSPSTVPPIRPASPYISKENALSHAGPRVGQLYTPIVDIAGFGRTCESCNDGGKQLRSTWAGITGNDGNRFWTVQYGGDYTCKGDSGGPVWRAIPNSGGAIRLIGVNSMFLGDGVCGYQGRHVDVARSDVNTWLVSLGAFQ